MPDHKAVTPSPPSEALQSPWYKELHAGHWRVLTASFLGWVFDGFDNYVLFLVVAPALRQLLNPEQLPHLSTYAGTVIASMLLGVGLGGLIAGVVADYLGRKRTMMLTILIYSICTGLTGLVHTWEQMAVFRFLAGLGMGGEWATGTALMAESWPTRARAKGLGIMQSAFGWGALTASLIWYTVGSAAGPSGWRYVFFIGVLPAFFVLYLRRKVGESEKWLAKRQERKDLQSLQRSGVTLSREERIVAGFTLFSLLRDPQLRRRVLTCLVMSLGTTVGFWGVSTWIPAYVESVARAANYVNPARWGGLAGVLFTMGSIVGYISSGFLADLIGRRGLLCFLFCGALITTPMVFLWTHSPETIVAAAALNGAFTLGQFAWMAIYAPELFPTALRATSISVVFNAARFVSILGPLAAGFLITRLGGYSTSAVVLSSVYIFALCAVPFLPETKGQPLPS